MRSIRAARMESGPQLRFMARGVCAPTSVIPIRSVRKTRCRLTLATAIFWILWSTLSVAESAQGGLPEGGSALPTVERSQVAESLGFCRSYSDLPLKENYPKALVDIYQQALSVEANAMASAVVLFEGVVPFD